MRSLCTKCCITVMICASHVAGWECVSQPMWMGRFLWEGKIRTMESFPESCICFSRFSPSTVCFFFFCCKTASHGLLHQEKQRRGSFRPWRTWASQAERSDHSTIIVCLFSNRRRWFSFSFAERWDWTIRFYLWHFLRTHPEDLPAHRHRRIIQEDVSLCSFAS